MKTLTTANATRLTLKKERLVCLTTANAGLKNTGKTWTIATIV
ncbi:hypothetical protein [Spirosoma montaniterrae]|nr:hypothetical protein [Spirosoma montaniterrae]